MINPIGRSRDDDAYYYINRQEWIDHISDWDDLTRAEDPRTGWRRARIPYSKFWQVGEHYSPDAFLSRLFPGGEWSQYPAIGRYWPTWWGIIDTGKLIKPLLRYMRLISDDFSATLAYYPGNENTGLTIEIKQTDKPWFLDVVLSFNSFLYGAAPLRDPGNCVYEGDRIDCPSLIHVNTQDTPELRRYDKIEDRTGSLRSLHINDIDSENILDPNAGLWYALVISDFKINQMIQSGSYDFWNRGLIVDLLDFQEAIERTIVDFDNWANGIEEVDKTGRSYLQRFKRVEVLPLDVAQRIAKRTQQQGKLFKHGEE